MKKVKDIEVIKSAVTAFKNKYQDKYYLAGVCVYPKLINFDEYASYDEYNKCMNAGSNADHFRLDYIAFLRDKHEIVNYTVADNVYNEYIKEDFKNRNCIYYSLEELGLSPINYFEKYYETFGKEYPISIGILKSEEEMIEEIKKCLVEGKPKEDEPLYEEGHLY